jgi:hypothetical protein
MKDKTNCQFPLGNRRWLSMGMKTRIALALVTIIVVALVACQPQSRGPYQKPPKPATVGRLRR